MLTLGWMLATWPAGAMGQQGSPSVPVIPSPPQWVSPSSADCRSKTGDLNPQPGIYNLKSQSFTASSDLPQDLLDRLRAMEQRLDQLTKQNEDLARENKTLQGQVPAFGGSQAVGDQPGGPGAPGTASDRDAIRTGGGRSLSRAAGGDPTAVGVAQEVGNLHLGKVSLNAYYDFDNAGYHLETKDKEFSIGVSGMTQLDGILYTRPTPGMQTSSGFYNPRTRIYFEGHVTEPISWEFSFQNFYDTVALLDAYVNFNYDPRFQVQIGRYKNPFGYEFYREHIWDLMAPERSVWANNYEANRRFGLMLHGVLGGHFLEYALGSFDTQRNALRPWDSLQDFEASLNFKPFYDREEGFWLRNLQFGGSCDVGVENQPLSPAVLRVNRSPGGEAVNSAGASNAASLPFLAFFPTVLERGSRDLWEAHLAYYCGGLSLVSTLEGGHESYSNGAAPRVHVPVDGWSVQAGYLLTGETIRDRTNIQPLRPFDLRQGRCGCGAWEVTARYSQIDLDSRVFTFGLADPRSWTNHVKETDVGVNWYLNQFVKVYFDWEHAVFGTPVLTTRGGFRSASDQFWLRAQVFF